MPLTSLFRFMRAWKARVRQDDEPIPAEVRADVRSHLAERNAQLNYWFFATRTALVLGLAGYFCINALASASAPPQVVWLLGAYALINVGVRLLGGRDFAFAPWAYAALDLSLALLLREIFTFEAFIDPNATLVGSLALVMISYTLYGNPKLSIVLALASLLTTSLALYLQPLQFLAATSAVVDYPLRRFLLIEYLSIACLVTCLLALRLHKRLLAYSVELYRRMEAAVEAAVERTRREQLEEVNRLKRTFITVLSHELRGPVTPLLTSLEVAEEEMNQGRPDPEMLSIAIESARTLERLIGDYTQLAELLTGGDDNAPRWNIRLNELLEDLLCQMNCAGVVTSGLDEFAAASDPHLLRGALRAVLRRAELRTPAGESISVQGFIEEHTVTLAIHDPASHVEPEAIEALDDPFSATSERIFFGPNTGIELTLAKHALCRAGGQLHVESAPGAGTTVFFELPAAEDHLRWLDSAQLRVLAR